MRLLIGTLIAGASAILTACGDATGPQVPRSQDPGVGGRMPAASTAPRLGPNLAPNPSFEAGAGTVADWIPNPNSVPATFAWDRAFGRTGTSSLKITTTDGGATALANPGWKTSGLIPLSGTGTRYRASVWTYTPDQGVGHIPAIQFFRADGSFIGTIGATSPSGLVDPVATWVEKVYDFDVSNFPALSVATHVRLIVVQDIYTTKGTTTSVYFDDVFFGERLPDAVQVDIDVMPGSDENPIACGRTEGLIPVAILTTPEFDASLVDHETVMFEGATEWHVDRGTLKPRRHQEDIDGDGDEDLLLHFALDETGLTCQSVEATLTGQTYGGLPIQGSDGIGAAGP